MLPQVHITITTNVAAVYIIYKLYISAGLACSIHAVGSVLLFSWLVLYYNYTWSMQDAYATMYFSFSHYSLCEYIHVPLTTSYCPLSVAETCGWNRHAHGFINMVIIHYH